MEGGRKLPVAPGAPSPSPSPDSKQKPKQQGLNVGTFVLTLVLAVFIGVLVYAGGSAWASAANAAIADSKLPKHQALWIYAAVMTLAIVGFGFLIAIVLKQLKITIPLDVTTVIATGGGGALGSSGGGRPPPGLLGAAGGAGTPLVDTHNEQTLQQRQATANAPIRLQATIPIVIPQS